MITEQLGKYQPGYNMTTEQAYNNLVSIVNAATAGGIFKDVVNATAAGQSLLVIKKAIEQPEAVTNIKNIIPQPNGHELENSK